MLHYFPKMRALTYAIGCGVPIAVILIWWLGFGGTVGVGVPGMIVAVLVIVTPWAAFNIANRRADARFQEIMDLYNEQCDPEAFLKAADEIAARMKAPYEPFEAWFLSFYALALLDVGRKSDAAKLGQAMQDQALQSATPDEQVSLISNVLPLVLRLFGPKAGLEVIDRGLAVIAEHPTPNIADQENYLNAQRQMVVAVMNRDADYLLERCSSIRKNESGVQQMRVRVLEAEKEAQIREIIGDAEGARECWRFVAENGNGLPSAKEAAKHVS